MTRRLKSMKRYELVQMTDPIQFRSLLAKAKISEEEKYAIMRERSVWLWENFKPSEEDMEYTRKRIRKKEEW